VRSRFISAVALYGPKSGPVRDFLAGVQATIAAHIGDRFRPYSLDQVHGTLIALDGVPDPATGAVVNEYYRTRTGGAAPHAGRATRTSRRRPPRTPAKRQATARRTRRWRRPRTARHALA